MEKRHKTTRTLTLSLTIVCTKLALVGVLFVPFLALMDQRPQQETVAESLPILVPVPVVQKPPTNINHTAAAARIDSATNLAKPASANPPKPATVTDTPPADQVEVVKVGAEPEIKPAQDLSAPVASAAPD